MHDCKVDYEARGYPKWRCRDPSVLCVFFLVYFDILGVPICRCYLGKEAADKFDYPAVSL